MNDVAHSSNSDSIIARERQATAAISSTAIDTVQIGKDTQAYLTKDAQPCILALT
jgi:hypothetical protein